LLPEAFRTEGSARKYPLPATSAEIQKLVTIPIPPGVRDSGTVYLQRALIRWQGLRRRKNSAILDTERRFNTIKVNQGNLKTAIKEMKAEAQAAVNEVKAEAVKHIANLSDLFSLGRKGIEGQMRAHLDGEQWRGEEISAKDFRECFRMVSQAVKGLGLPSDQREKARDAVMQEVAEAAESTKEALALAPGGKDLEVEH